VRMRMMGRVWRAGAGMANWSRVGITGYMINRYDV